MGEFRKTEKSELELKYKYSSTYSYTIASIFILVH